MQTYVEMRYRPPGKPTSPGKIIRDELKARGWTQKYLAKLMGRPEQAVSEIVNAKKRITPETAVQLGEAFGTSALFWANLETRYRMDLLAEYERAHAQDSH